MPLAFDGNSQFWFFCATVAFIVKIVLERHWAAQAARRHEQIKRDLAAENASVRARLNEIQATGHQTHILVNSARGLLLEHVALLTRRLAEMTQSPADHNAAVAAQAALADYQRRQATADGS